ncbi:MAG TPA: DinB family protein [Blastocatellia bacterium]|nr:DinB family protein [Blastocatellia bacterium]
MERPFDNEYASFYKGYVALVPEADILAVLTNQPAELRRLAEPAYSDRETYRYAPEKWSVRQVFSHLIDGERVFGYRVFSIGRGEKQPLPGFEENDYVATSDAAERYLSELVDEFRLVRESNLVGLRRFDDAAWRQVGTASGWPVSVRALAFIMAGHVRHHVGVLQSRYGLTAG